MLPLMFMIYDFSEEKCVGKWRVGEENVELINYISLAKLTRYHILAKTAPDGHCYRVHLGVGDAVFR